MADYPVRVSRGKDLSVEPHDGESYRFVSMLDDVAINPVDGREESIHRLRITGNVHATTFELSGIEVEFEVVPHEVCDLALAPAVQLNGLRIGPGFRRAVIDALEGTKGCTHLLSMAVELSQLHTLVTYAKMRELMPDIDHTSPRWVGLGLEIEPGMENACVALRSDSPVVEVAREHQRNED